MAGPPNGRMVTRLTERPTPGFGHAGVARRDRKKALALPYVSFTEWRGQLPTSEFDKPATDRDNPMVPLGPVKRTNEYGIQHYKMM